ncbi:hypothetical protein C4587_01805 [Candidatus Parcubacteria bacterium]|nr:MAG: hypothetical protein C4587_01805 [Candidatus Parcubacteria bacterium]
MDYDAMEADGQYGHMELNGLGQATTETKEPGWYEKYIQPILSNVGQVATAKAQYDLAKQQAKTGIVPSATLNVGVAPDSQKLLIYGGLALVGVLVLMQMNKRRR